MAGGAVGAVGEVCAGADDCAGGVGGVGGSACAGGACSPGLIGPCDACAIADADITIGAAIMSDANANFEIVVAIRKLLARNFMKTTSTLHIRCPLSGDKMSAILTPNRRFGYVAV